MNNLIISGYLIANPKYKEINISGEMVPLCDMGVFTKNGKDEETFRVTAWREKAAECSKLSRGNKIIVRGPVSLKKFITEKQQLCANMEVRADYIEILEDLDSTVLDKIPAKFETEEIF